MNTNDLNFAYKVRHALNERLEGLPASTTDRLASARKIALSRKKKDSPLQAFLPHRVLAGANGGYSRGPRAWLGRMGLTLPLAALVAGLIGIYQVEEQQRISETAEIDAAVLSDELPLSAYLDRGFHAYLTKRGE